jgi:rhodanese-related sulfurtransferase
MSEITVEELRSRLQKKEDVHLVDVREIYENEDFNIGGKNIPLNTLPVQLNELSGWKNEEVILYCLSGARSSAAVEFLSKQGFRNVRNLKGGMKEWWKNFGRTKV